MFTSDHCLLILYPLSKSRAHRRKTRFQFESMWSRDGGCRDLVEMAWSSVEVSGGGGGTDQFKTKSKSSNCNCSGGIEMSLGM